MGDIRNAYINLIGNTEGSRPLSMSGIDGRIILK
jgi:hypothetical protein